jgi:hypothetical protein
MLVSFDYIKKASNTKCFKCFNFELNQVIMQAAVAQIVVTPFVPKARANSAMSAHVFSVGTKIVAVPHDIPLKHLEDLRTQGFHTDGPRKYSSMQFDENGALRADAPASAVEDTAIPLEILHGPDASTSVLLALFKNTLLGIPRKSEIGRISSLQTVPAAEVVPLGTGVAFLFDTFHQV